jgi:hypothetical protein
MNKYMIPPVGTLVAIQEGDTVVSADEHTHICRIVYSEKEQQWVSNPADVRRGFIVFLNDEPTMKTTHIRISAIQPTGKGAWADPVALTPEAQGYYD